MDQNKQKGDIAIIGAGPSGYQLAIILAQRGFNVDMFEKRSDPLDGPQAQEGRSTNFVCAQRAYEGFKRAGILEQMLRAGQPIDQLALVLQNQDSFYMNYWRGPNGEPAISIKRDRVQQVYANRIKDFSSSIHPYYECKVSNIDIENSKFEVTYKDGKSEVKSHYEQIFACDGTYSIVQRQFLRSPDFNYSIQYSEYGFVEFYIPPDENGNFRVNGNTFFQYPRPGKNIYAWVIPNPESDLNVAIFMKLKGPLSLEYFKDKPDEFVTHFGELYPDLIKVIPYLKEDFEKINQVSRIITLKCFPWHKGKFFLVGDSAHSQSPMSGQGFNAAIHTSVMIDDLIDKYEGNWDMILEEVQKDKKAQMDACADYGMQSEKVFYENFFMEQIQIGYCITNYLTNVYSDIFRNHIYLSRWTLVPYDKAYGRQEIQRIMARELQDKIPELMDLVKEGKRDERVEAVILKYKDVYDAKDLAKIGMASQSPASVIQGAQDLDKLLYAKYIPTYKAHVKVE